MPRADPTGPSPEIVWPERLVRPSGLPVLMYLDLFVWIGLSKARVGRPDGAPAAHALELLRSLIAQGAVRVVLSDALYGEMHVIPNPRNRREVAETMIELTGGRYLLGRPSLMRLEIDSMVKKVLKTATLTFVEPVDLVGYGAHHAFGKTAKFRVLDADGADATEAARARRPDLDERFASEMAGLQLDVLAGPSDADLPGMRARGYAPEIPLATNEGRYRQELEQAQRFDTIASSFRRGRLRDAICAREYFIELEQAVNDVSARYGTSLMSYLTKDRQRLRDFVRGIPTAEVAVGVKTVFHRDPGHVWTTNDINDIDAACVAVPYCDVVLMDNATREALVRERFDERYATVLPKGLTGLTTYLEQAGGAGVADSLK